MPIFSKEVFVIVSDASGDEIIKDIYVYEGIEEVNSCLEDLTFANLDPEGNKIYHGALIPGHTIPESFQGCTPYIIIKNPERYHISVLENEAMFLKEECSPDKVANTITSLLTGSNVFSDDSIKLDIEDIYIFFGREVLPVLQITEDSVFEDEEFADRVTNMVEKFKQM